MSTTAQTDWRLIGASAVESRLAGPITGPVAQVWYAADGSTLYARTRSGKNYETQDFENWDPASANTPEPPATIARTPVLKPEPDARVFATGTNSDVMWGMGQQLYRSSDGKSWETLTSYRSDSVVGGGLKSLAISPRDANQLVLANGYGVWRSMDGGLTWSSLNLKLPNLAVRQILATPSGGHAAQILADRLGPLQLLPGNRVWQAFAAPKLQDEAARMQDYSGKLNATISAIGQSADGHQVYVGSDDGRIWRSADGGVSRFDATQADTPTPVPGHKVERLFVDPTDPQVVFAALSGQGHHVLWTFNGGLFWEPLDSSSLPDAPVNGVTADPNSGAVYVASDKGIFWTRFKFETGATPDKVWTSLSDSLPTAKAMDVTLDPAGVQLYAALDGYGLYGTPAPHRANGLRLVNTADQSTRAAAPGSMMSVMGEKVNSVSSGARPLPLWFNSQFQVPFEATGSTVSLALETASGRLTRDVALQPVSPAIFVTDSVPILYDADSGLQLEGAVAHPGERVQVMVNGLGKVQPDWQTGMIAPLENTPVVVAKVQAYLDGSEVQVTRATLAPGYVGMYVVEVQLPLVANLGAMELHITADGQQSNHVQIAIVQ